MKVAPRTPGPTLWQCRQGKPAQTQSQDPASRDWAGNVSNFPREITETALAHIKFSTSVHGRTSRRRQTTEREGQL